MVTFGKGDPLFLIPRGPGGSHFGLRSFDPLSTTNTLVYFDGFGRGKSDVAKEVKEYSLQRDIDDLEALRKAMGYSTINILGHSYGGELLLKGMPFNILKTPNILSLQTPFTAI